MPLDNEAQKAFLLELYRDSNADPGAQRSMYVLGEKIGLDKAAAKRTAEDLIGMGLVEIRTLSGGVGITEEGITAARQAGAGPEDENSLTLGDGTWIDDRNRQSLASLIKTLQQAVAKAGASYSGLEEMVIDIKTMEVHLLSTRPKTAVIRELLRALQASFSAFGDRSTAGMIERIIR
jgi:DNA-binding MarR family transcriptional regulator